MVMYRYMVCCWKSAATASVVANVEQLAVALFDQLAWTRSLVDSQQVPVAATERRLIIGPPPKAVENNGKTMELEDQLSVEHTFFQDHMNFQFSSKHVKPPQPCTTHLEASPSPLGPPIASFGARGGRCTIRGPWRPYDFTSWVKMANLLAKAAARKEDLAPWRGERWRASHGMAVGHPVVNQALKLPTSW